MRSVSGIQTVRRILKTARAAGTIAFVPTMGALHEGHLSLMRKARRECDFLAVSLFVNPLQFGPQEDFEIYPRDLAEDRRKARGEGADLLWTPSVKTLYPSGFQTTVEVSYVSRLWEGASRPGHFKGVTTVVAKLLQIIQPHRLYLGQKDYQQTCVIRQMIRDLHFDIRLRICPTIREKDGLAMSSRNTRLSPAARETASLLYRALLTARRYALSGERRAKPILQAALAILESAPSLKLDYIGLCDAKTLAPLEVTTSRAVLLAAVQTDGVRLIDNIVLRPRTMMDK
ncbi:MAG: pantoate--beta-alanine ligase [Nitrospiria bacterium]